jgi:Prokaryotic E2 family E
MKAEVAIGIDELRRQFAGATFTVREDNQGGAFVVIEPFALSPKYSPSVTWIGFQIPAQYPYADIYPVFIGANVSRANGAPFVVPITRGHQFEGRPAIQVSRRNGTAQSGVQKVTTKILKVLDYLERHV